MKLLMNINKDAFYAQSSFAEKHIPKAAGFRWHAGDRDSGVCKRNGKCDACSMLVPTNVWWSNEAALAKNLIQYADPAVVKAIGNVKAKTPPAPTNSSAPDFSALENRIAELEAKVAKLMAAKKPLPQLGSPKTAKKS